MTILQLIQIGVWILGSAFFLGTGMLMLLSPRRCLEWRERSLRRSQADWAQFSPALIESTSMRIVCRAMGALCSFLGFSSLVFGTRNLIERLRGGEALPLVVAAPREAPQRGSHAPGGAGEVTAEIILVAIGIWLLVAPGHSLDQLGTLKSFANQEAARRHLTRILRVIGLALTAVGIHGLVR